jgi:hypothetical protein
MSERQLPELTTFPPVCKYIESLNYPHTYVFAVWYFSNVLLFDRTKEGDKYVMKWPMPDSAYMTGFAAEQIGQWALLAFKDPKAWEGEYSTELRSGVQSLTSPRVPAWAGSSQPAKIKLTQLHRQGDPLRRGAHDPARDVCRSL